MFSYILPVADTSAEKGDAQQYGCPVIIVAMKFCVMP